MKPDTEREMCGVQESMAPASAPAAGVAVMDHVPIADVFDYPETVLLVEDEEALLVMEKTLFRMLGYSTLMAKNGREALEAYRTYGRGICIILLDLIMPVMGGVETYHELRKIDPVVPIIIWSGYGAEMVSDIIAEDAHARFVHKPFSPPELRNIMKQMREDARASSLSVAP